MPVLAAVLVAVTSPLTYLEEWRLNPGRLQAFHLARGVLLRQFNSVHWHVSQNWDCCET